MDVVSRRYDGRAGWHGWRLGVRMESLLAVALVVVAACSPAPTGSTAPGPRSTSIHLIRHVVVIFQENRSFDSYFGTFPGADGIPMQNGQPAVCVPDPAN